MYIHTHTHTVYEIILLMIKFCTYYYYYYYYFIFYVYIISCLDVEIVINYPALFTARSLKILSPNFCKRHLNVIKRRSFSFLKMGAPSHVRHRTMDPRNGEEQRPERLTVNSKRVQHTQRPCAARIRYQSRLYRRHSARKMLPYTGKTTSVGKM